MRSWVVAVCLLAPAVASAQYRPVVVHGDPVPGRSVTIDRARALAVLGGNRAVYLAKTSDNADILMFDNAGVDTEIALKSEVAPGGGTFGDLDMLRLGDQQLLFRSSVAGVDTVYAWTEAGGVRRVIGEVDSVGGVAVGPIIALSTNVLGQAWVNHQVLVEANGTATRVLRFGGPVPGDPGSTISQIANPNGQSFLSADGRISVGVLGTNGTYVLHGPATNIEIAESTATLPDMNGTALLFAATPGGLIAHINQFSTDDLGPTVTHFVMEVGAAGGGTEVLHLLDTTMFDVAGRSVTANSGIAAGFDDTGLLVFGVNAGVDTGLIAIQGGVRHKIAFSDETLPGNAGPAEVRLVSVSEGLVVLSSGPGADSGFYRWTPTTAIQSVVHAGDMVEIAGGALAASTSISAAGALDPTNSAPLAPDGSIGFIATYNDPVGGSTAGGYITGPTNLPQTDLALVAIPVDPVLEEISLARVAFLGLAEVINHGPSATRFMMVFPHFDEGTEITFRPDIGSSDEITLDETVCVRDIEVTRCSLRDPFAAGGAGVFAVAFGFNGIHNVSFEIVPLDAEDTNLDNNVLVDSVGTKPSDGGCLSIGQPGSALMLLAIVFVLRRRRRARTGITAS